MIDNKEKLKLEKEFINLLLLNKELVEDWQESGLNIKFFDDVHKTILRAINYAFSQGVLLTRKTFSSFVKKNIKSKLEILAQEHLFDVVNMMIVKKDDYPELKNRIFESFIDKNTIKSIEDYQKNSLSSGGLIAAKKLATTLNELVENESEGRKIYYESITSYAPIFYKDLVEKRNKEEDETIKCHIKEIDETLSVGFKPGLLTLFCGDVGSFKSTIMLNVGANIWELSKKNILYVPLEMPREMMFQKFASRETQIPFELFQHPKLLSKDQLAKIENFENYLKSIEEKTNSIFYIMEAPEQIPVSTIRREIEKHIDIFQPHIVIIDYIANLIPDENTYRKDRNDLEIGYMLKSLRTMGKPGSIHKEGFSVISGAQIGREGLKRYRKSGSKGVFYSEDIRGSHEYSADADALYAQMIPSQQNDNTRIDFICIKSRYGKKVFSNGSSKTVLEVRPEISLIKSINTSFFKDNHDEIMSKVNDLSFDEETKENDNKNKLDLIF